MEEVAGIVYSKSKQIQDAKKIETTVTSALGQIPRNLIGKLNKSYKLTKMKESSYKKMESSIKC